MVLHYLALSCAILRYIAWYSMVLHSISWNCMVLHGIAWYCMVKHGIAWYCMVLQYLALSCTIFHYLALSRTILHYLAPSCTMLHHFGGDRSGNWGCMPIIIGAVDQIESSGETNYHHKQPKTFRRFGRCSWNIRKAMDCWSFEKLSQGLHTLQRLKLIKNSFSQTIWRGQEYFFKDSATKCSILLSWIPYQVPVIVMWSSVSTLDMNGRSFLAHSKERAHSKNFIGHWLNEISYNCENFNEACNLFASLK